MMKINPHPIKAGFMGQGTPSGFFLRAACAALFLTGACTPANGSPDGLEDGLMSWKLAGDVSASSDQSLLRTIDGASR
jgi:hypothetical protein